jgi:hypothetical protein
VVTVGEVGTGTARNHTLPWVGWTQEERRVEANRRMRESRNEAIRDTARLAADWRAATQDFPADDEVTRNPETVEVLFDLLEERSLLTDLAQEERELLRNIMNDAKRLPELGFGSAAYMAGAMAILATKVTSADVERAAELRDLAGQWVSRGWNTLRGHALREEYRVQAEAALTIEPLVRQPAVSEEAA